MTTQSFAHGRLYQLISMVLCLSVLSSSIPQQGWSLLLGPRTAHAASTRNNFSSMLAGGTNSPLDQAMQIAGLEQVNMFGPNGEPNGILIDIGAMRAPTPREPDLVANPILVSRVQSVTRVAVHSDQQPAAGHRSAVAQSSNGNHHRYHSSCLQNRLCQRPQYHPQRAAGRYADRTWQFYGNRERWGYS
jgi:hypothetical protein